MIDETKEQLINRIENLKESNKDYLELIDANFKKNCKLEQQLKEADEVIEFYGDASFEDLLGYQGEYSGGKKAREYKKKWLKNE